jgi:hypothetical protein
VGDSVRALQRAKEREEMWLNAHYDPHLTEESRITIGNYLFCIYTYIYKYKYMYIYRHMSIYTYTHHCHHHRYYHHYNHHHHHHYRTKKKGARCTHKSTQKSF